MKKTLYLAVFFSGMTSLAVEMAASRLLGNVFGTSNIVWASIIGLILIYLAIGYFLGGYWADRSPSTKTFYRILIWASLLIAIVPVISRPVLRIAADAFDQLQLGILFGSFTAILILLSIPITLLGTASPFAIRLALQGRNDVGKISGRIYGISTLGSFIGTFSPVLILIPTIGTYQTFLFFSGVLLIISLVCYGIADGWRAIIPFLWTPFLIIALAIWGLPGNVKSTSGLIYETESSYNYIQVLEKDNFRLLRLNDGQGIHSIYHPTQQNYFGAWEQVLVGPFFNPAPHFPENIQRIAIVGLAAGTTARQATIAFGEIQIDGYEIDPYIVEVGKEFFEMNQTNLNVIIQDGRWGLSQSKYLYDIISVDAYRPPYIPWHMTTIEFFDIVFQHLTEDGVLVINVGRSPTDRRLIDALSSTVLQVFPTVHIIDIPYTFNSIIFATAQHTDPINLSENLAFLEAQNDTPMILIESMRLAAENLQSDPPSSLVFTDDRAPIEWITNTMIFNFLLSDDMEIIQ
ncbi:MAG: fused MFS/spermidine synthase [Anaerolineaceae bacterium]|nr:fused MFS/spermidine synthase [Anaerolineaceae bacterium]